MLLVIIETGRSLSTITDFEALKNRDKEYKEVLFHFLFFFGRKKDLSPFHRRRRRLLWSESDPFNFRGGFHSDVYSHFSEFFLFIFMHEQWKMNQKRTEEKVSKLFFSRQENFFSACLNTLKRVFIQSVWGSPCILCWAGEEATKGSKQKNMSQLTKTFCHTGQRRFPNGVKNEPTWLIHHFPAGGARLGSFFIRGQGFKWRPIKFITKKMLGI